MLSFVPLTRSMISAIVAFSLNTGTTTESFMRRIGGPERAAPRCPLGQLRRPTGRRSCPSGQRGAALSGPPILRMKLSVVVPVFNEKATIAEIIDRVRGTKLNIELIVVDDGSTDGTREVLKQIGGRIDHLL